MIVSRRLFLRNCALTAIGCAATSRLAFAGSQKASNASGSSKTLDTPLPGRSAFASQVGSTFAVTPADSQSATAWLILAAVKDLPPLAPVNPASMAVSPPKSKDTKTSGFELSFTGGPVPGLAQGTYTFENSRLGKFSLFIVPTHPGSQFYIAVFNHLTEEKIRTSAAASGIPAPRLC